MPRPIPRRELLVPVRCQHSSLFQYSRAESRWDTRRIQASIRSQVLPNIGQVRIPYCSVFSITLTIRCDVQYTRTLRMQDRATKPRTCRNCGFFHINRTGCRWYTIDSGGIAWGLLYGGKNERDLGGGYSKMSVAKRPFMIRSKASVASLLSTCLTSWMIAVNFSFTACANLEEPQR